MDIRDNVVEAIGGTPLVRLGRLHPPGNLAAKVEHMNPGGSIKDRIGMPMIERAEANGWLEPGGVIVEPTSGNTGVGLAMAAAIKGYRLIAVMADKQSKEKQDLLRAYGAEVVVCPTDVDPEDPESYYSVAERLTQETPGAYRPDQYSNPANPQAQYETTGPELWNQTDGTIRHFVAGVGTGGTITGAGRYLKEQDPSVQIVGVDPEGSIYTADSDDDVTTYLTEGVGEDFWPETFDPEIVDRWEMVTDAESFEMTRRLSAEEGLLVGGSCGMAAVGALRVAEDNPADLVVVILPDSGRNYLSKIFDDDWMRANGFLD
ncbi:MAG: pyridoxal-phosphate dependent enzyme [Acidimicrobiia bacterium]|nr:pyridoxal-phosphate dependent enzyme [Acidimicrobiia bacterium]